MPLSSRHTFAAIMIMLQKPEEELEDWRSLVSDSPQLISSLNKYDFSKVNQMLLNKVNERLRNFDFSVENAQG